MTAFDRQQVIVDAARAQHDGCECEDIGRELATVEAALPVIVAAAKGGD